MEALYSLAVPTEHGVKHIEVYNCDILNFDGGIDILTTSAFEGSYMPNRRSLFGALSSAGIRVQELAAMPDIDLRRFSNIWLSREINATKPAVRRIGCIEMSYSSGRLDENRLLTSVVAYFHMLEIASAGGVSLDTVALPLLGSGTQGIAVSMMLIPVINECVAFLKRNTSVKRILFIERSYEKAALISSALQRTFIKSAQAGYTAPAARPSGSAMVFISYSSNDRKTADLICNKLENLGVKVWYAPRNVHGAYADSIVDAIAHASHFMVLASGSSMTSEHVLNEVNLAHQRLQDGLSIKPLLIDKAPMSPSFMYYLSRQHWIDISDSPSRLDDALNEIVREINR